MANHDYIISEAEFFKDKNDENNRNFLKGTGIDLSKECSSTIPTIKEIKQSLINFNFEVSIILILTDRLELSASKDKNSIWLIFTDDVDDNLRVSMFEIGRGSDYDLTLDFVKYLGKTHGRFLLYSDSGIMSLIEPDKSNELIKNEFLQ